MAVSGIGGGAIDVAGIVSQLMTIEQQPLVKMQQNLSGIQTKLSAWGKLQAAVSNLRDATRALTRNDTWQASKAASSDEASISATGGGSAAAGNYSLSVQSLAQSQSVVSRTFAASDTVVGGGTLQIQLGSIDATGTTFTADPERLTSVTRRRRRHPRRHPQRDQQFGCRRLGIDPRRRHRQAPGADQPRKRAVPGFPDHRDRSG